MVRAEEQFPFREVHQQGDEVGSAALDFHVVALGQAINAQVHLRAAGHSNGDLFAQEEVRVPAENFCSLNGVMVGQRNDGHPQAFQSVIDFPGVAVRLPANPVQNRRGEHSGGDRVNMEVASHDSIFGYRYEQSMKKSRNLYECVHGTY